jgi:formate hydrogenlyase subunit 3/multisubunit Na+/H+ antiporter MnhD subunit
MNILCIPLLLNTAHSEFVLSLFILTHCLLSSLFFFIIDCLIKRYNSRSSVKITGLIHSTPLFATMLFISLIFFSGLPFTAKFLCEILIFNSLLNFNSNLFLLVFISANFIGLIGFSKNFFNVLFGAPLQSTIIYDLSRKETLLFGFLLISLFFISYMSFVL